MKRIEKMAIDAGVTRYSNVYTDEIDVLGEENFYKMAAQATRKGKGYHGFRTGAYNPDVDDYWWTFRLGHDSNPIRTQLILNNMD